MLNESQKKNKKQAHAVKFYVFDFYHSLLSS